MIPREPVPIAVLSGIVVSGRGKGRTVGMPTANLLPSSSSHLPENGVYTTVVSLKQGRFRGVTNVGTRPSVDDDRRITVETHILQFEGDLYGAQMTVEFYHYLRPIQKMASLNEVKRAVEKDAGAALSLPDSLLRDR